MGAVGIHSLTRRRRLGKWDLDVQVFFGSGQPAATLLAAAQEELHQLIVPAE